MRIKEVKVLSKVDPFARRRSRTDRRTNVEATSGEIGSSGMRIGSMTKERAPIDSFKTVLEGEASLVGVAGGNDEPVIGVV